MTIAISDVETVWANVFTNVNVQAISTNVLNYEYTDNSQSEIEALYLLNDDGIGEVNFFEYVVEVASEVVIEVGGQQNPERNIEVSVRYTKAQDPEGEADSEVKLGIETVLDTVRTVLGSDWGISSLRLDPEITVSPVAKEQVNNITCLRQIATFKAYKQ